MSEIESVRCHPSSVHHAFLAFLLRPFDAYWDQRGTSRRQPSFDKSSSLLGNRQSGFESASGRPCTAQCCYRAGLVGLHRRTLTRDTVGRGSMCVAWQATACTHRLGRWVLACRWMISLPSFFLAIARRWLAYMYSSPSRSSPPKGKTKICTRSHSVELVGNIISTEHCVFFSSSCQRRETPKCLKHLHSI